MSPLQVTAPLQPAYCSRCRGYGSLNDEPVNPTEFEVCPTCEGTGLAQKDATLAQDKNNVSAVGSAA